jgi:hypothetical protein
MKKNYVLLTIFSLYAMIAGAQSAPGRDISNESSAASIATRNIPSYIDTVAVLLLDKMASTIGGVDQACFDVQSVYDLNTEEFGFIKNSDKATICVKGSDKLIADIDGDKGHRQFYFDGENFTYYSWDNNQYAQVNIDGNIIDAIDAISRNYGVEFPGIDVFYPTFTDDAITSCTQLSFLGQTVVDGKECFHIAAKTPLMTWQLWISNDIYFLPVKLLIRYTASEGSPEYEFNYSNYNLNAGLPDEIFNFTPPPKAQHIQLLAK